MQIKHLIPAEGYHKHKEATTCHCNPKVMTTTKKGLIIPIRYAHPRLLLIIHNPANQSPGKTHSEGSEWERGGGKSKRQKKENQPSKE